MAYIECSDGRVIEKLNLTEIEENNDYTTSSTTAAKTVNRTYNLTQGRKYLLIVVFFPRGDNGNETITFNNCNNEIAFDIGPGAHNDYFNTIGYYVTGVQSSASVDIHYYRPVTTGTTLKGLQSALYEI